MRATRAIIHLSHLRHNIGLIRDHVRTTRPQRPPRLCVAVKADAYGHGIVEIGRAAVEEGVEYLAVATIEEAVILRDAAVSVPVLVYSLPIPEELSAIVEYGLSPLVGDRELVVKLAAEAKKRGRRVPVHIKIDTGMGRIGCRPAEAPELAAAVQESPWLHLEGMSTHFPVSDIADRTFTLEQVRIFEEAAAKTRQKGINPGILSAANSGAALASPEAYFDMVRPGILVYGYYPSEEQERILPVKPVMELESRIVFVKSVPAGTGISYGLTHHTDRATYIGTVPIGYADGYSRLLSNRSRVLVNGRSVPVVGRICMDQCMIDLGAVPAAKLYDRVVLFGHDPAGPDAEELSRTIGTIPYEVTCGVSKRVPRVYPTEDAPSTVTTAAAAETRAAKD
ncbi:MAG TPA: alanine racemase [Spirochaetia bacterium]|nr:alanine racemase [Spirochaetia bacterium]